MLIDEFSTIRMPGIHPDTFGIKGKSSWHPEPIKLFMHLIRAVLNDPQEEGAT